MFDDVGARRPGERAALARKAPQYGIYERGSALEPGCFHELDAVVDDGGSGKTLEVEELICRQTERIEHLHVQAVESLSGESFELVVDRATPAQRAGDEIGSQ